MNFIHTKKFRHGSLSLALTVAIIAAVILLNAIFTALTDKYLWYIDMTPEPRFTLSDEAKGFLDQMDKSKKVRILLCDERDAWEADTLMLEVLKTARDIEKFYDNVTVEYVDIYTNPSAVNQYRGGKAISTQSVIVVCDSTSRVYNLENFFKVDESGYVVGYNGEQTMVSGVLSVTQASAPVAALSVGHGEEYSEAFTTLLAQLGFEVKTMDLLEDSFDDEEFKDCRLLVICDPQRDFDVADSASDISEIDKIDDFLAESKSMIVLFDKDTPTLKRLEGFLKEWGIEIARTDDEIPVTPLIRDLDSSGTVNGFTNKALYASGENTGTAITKPLRESSAYQPPVYFPNTTALRFSEHFQQKVYEDYTSANSIANGRNRTVYNVFTSSPTAEAMVGNTVTATATEDNLFSYMMLSCESIQNYEMGSISHAFVLACASTDFASTATLPNDRYGNAAVLSYACNTMGSLVVPVAIDCKYYASMEIASITASAANQYTVILTVIPASIVFIAGIYIMIRRKHA